MTDISPEIARSGDEVFVYFSTFELADPQMVDLLATLPLPRRGYLPAASPQVAARLVASGMVLEDAPVPVSEIARRSSVLLTAGQHGILSLGLYAGIPQVCLPQHQEHLWHANAACAQGVGSALPMAGRTVASMEAAIMSVYGNRTMLSTATQIAQALRASLDGDPNTITERVVRPLVHPLLGLA